MTETIILAPGAGSSELLRTLAKFGKNTLGLRVLSIVELAKYALMKNGISITEEFLTAKEEPSVIYSFLNEIDYFSAASFADAESLSSALSTMRSLIPTDEKNELEARLASGEFPEKNAAILEVYERFLDKCCEDDRIDSISLVRKAIEETEAVTGADYLTLRECPLMPLDKALIEAVSGGDNKELSLVDLFEREKNNASDLSFTEGYGRINEAEDIIDGIFRNEIPLDKCVIAAADTSAYAQVFYDLSCSYDIPVTYGCGVPILNSNPARLLKLIYEWKTKGYYGIDALRRIINSDAFDRKEFAKTLGMDGVLSRKDADELAQMAGSIRLSFDAAENRKRLDDLKAALDKEAADANVGGITKNIKRAEYRLKVYDWTSKLAGMLSHGCTDFLSKYVLIRTDASGRVTNSAGRIDQSAVNIITEALDAYIRYAPDGDIDEIIPEVLNKTVCSENSREGCLHITSIAGAMSCMRENLYVCGLSSSEFPGSPTENYLLLDSDLTLLADEEIAPTSENRIRRNVRSLYDLLDLASALDVKTHLSYSGYSLSELKEQNPSSVLFSIYERLDPDADVETFKNALRQAPYFGSAISADRIVGDEYSKGAEFKYEGCPADKKDAAHALNRAWSPSALSNYLQCPRHFYLENVLGIKVNEDDDPFEVFSAAVTGTLAHTMMEKLAAEDYSKDDFLEASSRAFDEALQMRPPVHPSDADALKKDFLKMMETSFDKDPRNTVLSAEEEYTFDHPSGIRIHGYPDRVEQDADGKYLIADFKTKRNIEHEQDDFSTCMQVVVYAWLCEQAGIDISECEYRYLRKGKTVTCRYADEKEKEEAVLEAEKLRLLYVAATRAANILVISCSLKSDETPAASNPWLLLYEVTDEDIFESLGSVAIPATEEKLEFDAEELYEKAESSSVLKNDASKAASYSIRKPSTVTLKGVTSSEDDYEDKVSVSEAIIESFFREEIEHRISRYQMEKEYGLPMSPMLDAPTYGGAVTWYKNDQVVFLTRGEYEPVNVDCYIEMAKKTIIISIEHDADYHEHND